MSGRIVIINRSSDQNGNNYKSSDELIRENRLNKNNMYLGIFSDFIAEKRVRHLLKSSRI